MTSTLHAPASAAPDGPSLAEFKAALEVLRPDDIKGLATSLFIQTRILSKYAPVMVDTANRELNPDPGVGNRVVGSTIPRTADQQAAAQFFADNPSAAAVALKWYLSRNQA